MAPEGEQQALDESLPLGFFDEDHAGYEDLLGTQIPMDLADIPTTDRMNCTFEGPKAETSLESSTHSTQDDTPDSAKEHVLIDLDSYESDVEPVSQSCARAPPPAVKMEEQHVTVPNGAATKVINKEDVLNLEDQAKVTVKDEDLESDVEMIGPEIQDKVIELSDSEDDLDVVVLDQEKPAAIKAEKSESNFSWTKMTDDIIDLLDSDDDQEIPILAQSCHVTQKNRSVSTPIETGLDSTPLSDLGRSALQKSTESAQRAGVDHAALLHAQQVYIARAKRTPIVTGAGGIFHGTQGLPDSLNSDDVSAGIFSTPIDVDSEADDSFLKVKQSYKALKKAGKNTMNDDILFMAAQKKERIRYKKFRANYLQARGLNDSEDEDEVGEDDYLFRPVFTPSLATSTAKRSHAALNEGSAGGPESGSDKEDESSPDKRPKSGQSDKRAYMKELKAEEHQNMMAGIEKIIYDAIKKESKEEQRASKGTKKLGNSKASKGSSALSAKGTSKITKKAKSRAKISKPNPSKPGYLNNLGSLMSNNVYDDANANLRKAKLITSSEKDKRKAMSEIIASVPLEDIHSSRREKNHIIKATVTLGKRKVTAVGMISPLLHYQVQGSAWMKEREIGNVAPLGGVVADQMGLGKTVMTLGNTTEMEIPRTAINTIAAAMLANRPSPGEQARCTLIVATPALITQWMSELEKHIEQDIFPIVVRHCSSTKLAGPGALVILQQADVVLTTYSEIIKSYPKCEPPEDLKTLEQKKDWWYNLWDKGRGALHRVMFNRLVLDEAHVIKNHMSQTSIACRALMARHRWAISGTPIQNRVSELYPYFKFLRVPHTGSFGTFKQNFCVGGDESTERLHTYLRQFMIRRTHSTSLMGAPLLTLPENHQETIVVEFNEIERELYKMVRDRFIGTINNFSKEGTLEKKGKLILTMCLRLRQLTAHPFLIQDTIEHMFTVEDLERLWILTRSEVSEDGKRGQEMYAAMKRMIENKGQPTEEEQDGIEETPVETAVGEHLQDPPTVFKFRKYLRSLKDSKDWENFKRRGLCHKCGSPPDEPYVTSCLHLYCKECLSAMAYEASKTDENETNCLKCGQVFTDSHPCSGIEELEMEDPAIFCSTDIKSKRRHRKDLESTLKWIDFGGEILPSSKTLAAQIQLERWMQEDPDKKIIVFSQFHLLMTIVGRICERRKWGYCTYHGKMSHEARDEALNDFRDDHEKKILIASLKCGGVGLNLTMASRVICIDLWWNSCVEQQAFCRVFRIGQEFQTFITRFVVKDTIDETLREMQAEKEKAIGGAIDDTKMLKRMLMPELMRLFGPVGEDSNGRPFILVDDNELGSIVPKDKPAARKETKASKITKALKRGKATKGGKGGKGSKGQKGTRQAEAAEEDPEDIQLSFPTVSAEDDEDDSLFL